MSPTIKDLARVLNLAPSTISMALNNNPKISKETRKKVQAIAKRMNYRPNIIARAMVRKKTNLIGLLITDVMSSFFPQVIEGIEEVVSEHFYSVLLCSPNLDPHREFEYLNLLKQKRVDSIIADPIVGKANVKIWSQFHSLKIPVVFILTRPPIENGIFVGVDNIKGGWLAGDHLVNMGRRVIAHLGGPKHLETSQHRKSGFIKALKDHNIEVHQSLIIEGDFNWESGYRGMKTLLERESNLDAVFCASDISAIGASYAIREAGLKVPDDIAIVGFDDLFIAAIAEVPLTTIAQPKYELGVIAGQKLLAMMDGKKVESEILEPKLRVRYSCGHKDKIPLREGIALDFDANFPLRRAQLG